MLCVIAKPDDTAVRELARVRRAAFPGGIAADTFHGHITIATYIGDDEAGFVRRCGELIRGIPSFTVRYEGIEILRETSIVVAVPEKAAALEALHRRIAREYGESLDIWTGTDRWRPHTTLFCGPDADLEEICRAMARAFVPFAASVQSIEFSRVLDTGYEITQRIGLS